MAMEQTPERRAEQSAKMKAYWALRKAKKYEEATSIKQEEETKQPEEVAVEHPQVQPETVQQEVDVNDLMKQIAELKDMQWKLMAQQVTTQPQNANVGVQGLTGTVDKFDMVLDHYPDPSERLAKEPKLQRFAFTMNYETEFKVSETSYTTIDNVRMREPKFTLELIRIMLDEDSGEDTGGRFSVARMTLHEDPDTALVIARNMGMNIDTQDEATFLNEMRYIRMRDWVLDCFYPPKVESHTQRKQTVIAGRLVEYWEKDTDKSTGITKDQWDRIPRIKF